MERLHPTELPALSMIPGYPNIFLGNQIWLLIGFQLTFCITSSILMTYLFYRKFYPEGNKTWKKAVEMMGPIRKRLQNLEKERVIWNSYLEWIEDYCAVYYGLLSYLNSTVTDLDKLYQYRDMTLKNFIDCSEPNSQSDLPSVQTKESLFDAAFPNEISWANLTLEEDGNMSTQVAQIFANVKSFHIDKRGSGDLKREEDIGSTTFLEYKTLKEIKELEQNGSKQLDSGIKSSEEIQMAVVERETDSVENQEQHQHQEPLTNDA